MNKLKKMTAFVLDFKNECEDMEQFVDCVENYAYFLMTDLHEEMFIGENPFFRGFELENRRDNTACLIHINSRKLIAWESDGDLQFNEFETVEDLCDYEPELTDLAKNTIGL